MTPEKILDTVCEHYRINKDELLKNNTCRKQEYREVRQVTMFFLHKTHYPEHTYNWIGEVFFDKHHATALHSIKTVREYRETDKRFKAKTDQIFEKLGITYK